MKRVRDFGLFTLVNGSFYQSPKQPAPDTESAPIQFTPPQPAPTPVTTVTPAGTVTEPVQNGLPFQADPGKNIFQADPATTRAAVDSLKTSTTVPTTTAQLFAQTPPGVVGAASTSIFGASNSTRRYVIYGALGVAALVYFGGAKLPTLSGLGCTCTSKGKGNKKSCACGYGLGELR